MQEEDCNSDNSCGSCLQTKEKSVEHGIMTVNTGVSVADYFAKKMAALKQVAAAPPDSLVHADVITLKVLTLFSRLYSLVQSFLVECDHKAANS